MRRYAVSGNRDLSAAEEACDALQNLVVREPQYGANARLCAWQFVVGMWANHRTDLMVDAVRAGLDADLMTDDADSNPGPAALLLTHLGASQQRDDRRLDGLTTLRDADERLAGHDPGDVLAAAAHGHSALVRAQLQELGLELVEARAAFAEARQWLGRLAAEPARRQFLEASLRELYGADDDVPLEHREGLQRASALQLDQWHTNALFGALRTHDGDGAELTELAEAVRTTIAADHVAKAVHPLLLVNAISRLAPSEARAFSAALLDAMSAPVPVAVLREIGSLPPEVIEQYGTSETSALSARAFEMSMAAAAAAALARTDELETANRAYHDAVTSAIHRPGSPAVPLAFLFGAYAAFLARHSRDEERAAAMIDMFLTVLDSARRSDPDAFRDLRLRALFDPFVAEAASWLLPRADDLDDEADRHRIAGLLDLLRVPEVPPMLMLSKRGLPGDEQTSLADGMRVVQDTIGRIAEAITGVDGVVAIIAHEHESGEQDVVLIDSRNITVHRLETAFADAVAELDRVAELALFKSGAGLVGATTDDLTMPARTAFDALPDVVQQALRTTDVVLVAPDHRDVQPDVPWELLHDGENHLMGKCVIARFTSLRHLARTLDTPAPRTDHALRALVVAAAEGLPMHALPTADPEVAAVRDTLTARGFDTPSISPGRLSANFVMDRLDRIDALHVAAHGTSEAGTEYVVLPGEERLSVDDLVARPRPRVPFIYLNTCQLGRTRYLGGGQARGLAFTFAELGAPAVVANTTDVLDKASTSVALRFYEATADDPVGLALLSARQRLLADGVDPAAMARIVLIGDPWHHLDPGKREDAPDDVAGDVLRAYFDIEPTADGAAMQRITERLAEDPVSHRLIAAQALVAAASAIPLQSDQPASQQTRVDVDSAIALADELRCPQAQAVLRLMRTEVGVPEPARMTEEELLRDAVVHLEALGPKGSQWSRMAIGIRARLRRAVVAARGLTITKHVPPGQESDEVMDAAVDAMLVAEQMTEEQHGRVTPRLREATLHDISYNAVVLGHPNRFEDTVTATAFCSLVTRKLVAHGHVSVAAKERALPMLCGLLWHLWSTQITSYLDRDMAEGQAGTVDALVRDIVAGRPTDAVLGFPAEVDRVLADLDELPWERVHIEVPEQMAKLAQRAEELLKTIPSAELPAAAAFVTGTLAVKNTFTSLEGQDEMEDQMTEALWTLSRNNEARFEPYLWEGFTPIRDREPDELLRWRTEDMARPAADDAGTEAKPR